MIFDFYNQMEKQNKENFIELPLHAFKKKLYPIPQYLIESKLQRTSKNLAQLKKIIEFQEYICLATISEERNIFCVKVTTNDKLGIIEVKEVSSKNKCIYVSLNINSFLKKEIRSYFIMKNWKIQNKICIQDERGSGIALLQYNFAEMDLRNFINKHQEMGCKLTDQAMYKISKDLTQNLCKYHLEETTILDIRPQTILFQDGKWFILNGDNASKGVNQFGSTLSKPISSRFTDTHYVSPLILESQMKSDWSINHNPYKSDVFSLGLVFLQLLSLGNTENQHAFKDMLQNRKDLKEFMKNYQLSFRQKLLIVGNKIMKLPDSIELMLAQKEENRVYIFQLCLKLGFTQSMTEKFLPSYELFFKQQVVDQLLPSRKRIIYTQSPVQYEGQIDLDAFQERQHLIRSGRGTMYYNGQKTFEGQWLNNLPNGKCTVQFSMLLSYQGNMQNGRLHGQGMLSFNGSRIGENQWHYGLNQQKQMRRFQNQPLDKGFYLFIQRQGVRNMQHLGFFNKLLNTNIQFVINLCEIKKLSNISQIIKKFFKPYEIKTIHLKGKTQNYLYHSASFQLIIFEVIDQKQETLVIHLITHLEQSAPFLIKLIKQAKIELNIIKLQCKQNTQLGQDLFRELIEIIPFRVLNFSGCTQFSDNVIRFLSQTKHSLKLRQLYLSKTNISDKGLNQLLFSQAMQHLVLIDLSDCKRLSSQKLAQFFCHPNTFNLQHINISGLGLDHNGFQKIVSICSFKKLKNINLGMCPKISECVAIEFLKLSSLINLQKLNLYSTTYKDIVLETLGSNDTAINDLVQIDLSGSINFSSQGFSKYLLSQNVIQLKVLNLSNTEISDELLCLLSKKSSISQTLVQLKMASCYSLTDKGLRQLLRPQKFVNLEYLDISKNNFSNDTLFVLSEVTSRVLQVLSVSKCAKMNDIGLQKFLNSQNIRRLRQFNIKGTGIKSSPFIALCNSKYTTSIKVLNISQCLQIQESDFIRYASSQRLALLQELNLSNTLLTSSTLKVIENNPHLYNCMLKVNTEGCRYINNEMRHNISLIKKIVDIQKEQSSLHSQADSLAKSTILTKLSQLQINKKQVPNLQKIFQSQYIINLQKLTLNWITLDSTLGSMIKNINLNNLKHFNISGCSFQQEKLQTFFKSNMAKNITYLDLSWTNCSNFTLNAIAESLTLNNLKILKLAKCSKINDKGFTKYFSYQKASFLTQLDLRSTLITNSTLQTIFGSKFLKNLSILCLRSCQNIKANGFKQYFKSGACSYLKDLDISWTKINGQIFSYMSSSKKLNQLYSLRLAGLKTIEFQFCKFLQSTSASSLTLIDVNYTDLSFKFLHSIESSRYLSGLQELHFKGFELNDSNIPVLSGLIRSSNSSKLTTLKLSKTKTSNMAKFLKSFSNYTGKLQQLCIIGLTKQQVQQWQATLKKIVVSIQDKSNDIQ